MSNHPIKVLVVEPAKAPYVKEIDGSLESMQDLVGGGIEAAYPYDEPVALVCSGEGKLAGLQPNRYLRLEDGTPYDIVCGTFFLAGLGGETFVSLTSEQIRHFDSLYRRDMLVPFPKKKERADGHER